MNSENGWLPDATVVAGVAGLLDTMFPLAYSAVSVAASTAVALFALLVLLALLLTTASTVAAVVVLLLLRLTVVFAFRLFCSEI